MNQTSDKIDIKSLDYNELTEYIVSLGEKKFRAAQLYEWMHVKCAGLLDMTNIPKALKQKLTDEANLIEVNPVKTLISEIDGTRKYLFKLQDNHVIESVLMRYKHGNSVCISSQVGCRMGCKFCASTLGGLVRNLTPSEMLEQIYAISRDTGERVSNVVVMGSGEPMDNFDNIVKFVRLLSDEHGLHISQRNITISTCGLVPNIYKLADEKYQITLAISLHAPSDEIRRQIMPVADSYGISELMKACRYYFETTGRRVTFEYSLAKGVNDSPKCAEMLAKLLMEMHGHVNLIPVNPVKETEFEGTTRGDAAAFKALLEKKGINATIRREMGRDINGACGQLRRDYIS